MGARLRLLVLLLLLILCCLLLFFSVAELLPLGLVVGVVVCCLLLNYLPLYGYALFVLLVYLEVESFGHLRCVDFLGCDDVLLLAVTVLVFLVLLVPGWGVHSCHYLVVVHAVYSAPVAD